MNPCQQQTFGEGLSQSRTTATESMGTQASESGRVMAAAESIKAHTSEPIVSTIIADGHATIEWGRKAKAKWQSSISSLAIVTGAPILIIVYWTALEHYGGSISATVRAAAKEGPVVFLMHHLPRASAAEVCGYAAWLGLQALLYGLLPGKLCQGQRTPGGHLLSYTANGLLAWAVTHLAFLVGSVSGMIDPAIVARHWQGLLAAANIYGIVLSAAVQVKGHYFPSYPEDRKISGDLFFDYFGGIELNPRIGKDWDIKFFHNGRPGIVAWTLIDLSWAAYQYQTLGHVTASMLIVLLLHSIYVVDFFCNEDWYTRTIDISHDHFGFMLAWGDTTFLPAFYTLQVQYLARYPTYLTTTQATAILGLGLFSYAIFRSANAQKDHVRSRQGEARVWGRPAEFIACKYRTSDGKQHSSLLITCGWWGVSRHANYLADIVGSFAYCATCGLGHFLPWSYLVFMCILLYTRILRDERRCHRKYGAAWEKYCEAVPHRLIPGLL